MNSSRHAAPDRISSYLQGSVSRDGTKQAMKWIHMQPLDRITRDTTVLLISLLAIEAKADNKYQAAARTAAVDLWYELIPLSSRGAVAHSLAKSIELLLQL